MEPNAALRRSELMPVALLQRASDQRLVEQVRGGSERAFEALFDRHRRSVLAFCRRMLGSAEEAEDVMQVTFMAAYRALVESEPPLALRPWLFGIARHRCLSALRRREHPVGEVPETIADHLGAEVATRDDLRAMLADMARLPDDQRVALVLAELGDLPHDEIAQVIRCRREKVKALVFQARASLIAARASRETPCADIRAQLLTLRGGALRRSALRRHLRDCPGCREFREQLRGRRRLQRVLLPAAPVVGLKRTVLGTIFGSGGAGGAAVSGTTFGVGGLVAASVATVAIQAGGIRVLGGSSRSGGEGARTAVSPYGRPAAASEHITVSAAQRLPGANRDLPARSRRHATSAPQSSTFDVPAHPAQGKGARDAAAATAPEPVAAHDPSAAPARTDITSDAGGDAAHSSPAREQAEPSGDAAGPDPPEAPGQDAPSAHADPPEASDSAPATRPASPAKPNTPPARPTTPATPPQPSRDSTPSGRPEIATPSPPSQPGSQAQPPQATPPQPQTGAATPHDPPAPPGAAAGAAPASSAPGRQP